MADGTPGDGSWTFFLDSARLTYDAKDIKTKFDSDLHLPERRPMSGFPRSENQLRDSPRYPELITPDRAERAGRHRLRLQQVRSKNTTIDGYFIYKGDDRTTFERRGVPTPGDNADIYTVGGKHHRHPGEHWQYSVEGAYQFGKKEDTIDRRPRLSPTARHQRLRRQRQAQLPLQGLA